MEEWKEYKLGEVCKSIADGDHMPPPKTDKGIPFVTISNIVGNRLDFANTHFVPQSYYDDLDDKRRPHIGDTIYSVVGTFGKPVYVNEEKPFVFQRHIAILRPDNSMIVPQFLFYTLLSPQFYRKADVMAIGAVQRTISLTSLRNVTIQLPPLDIQSKIVGMLSSLDNKIEVNRRINENLEQQAQALFKSWFVDFEPFKDQPFVESELGMIPQGWKVEKIEDLAEKMGSGGTPKSLNKEYYSGEIRWFSTKELKDCFLFDSEKHISLDALNNSAAKLFPEGTILMAIYAAPTVGRLGILTKTSSFNQAAVGIVPKVTIGMEFLFLSLLSERTNLNNLASGAAQQNLNVGIVKNYRIVIPPLDVLNKFNPIANGFFEKIRTIQQESHRLAELRDTLLPRLMSGELKVNDLENNEI